MLLTSVQGRERRQDNIVEGAQSLELEKPGSKFQLISVTSGSSSVIRIGIIMLIPTTQNCLENDVT